MRRPPVARSAARVLLIAGVLTGALAGSACSGPTLLDHVNRAVADAASSAADTAPPRSSSASGSSGVPATPGPSATSLTGQAVPPALALLRRLKAMSTANWATLTDPRTGVRFALPTAVPSQTRLQNGISQRVYENKPTKQTSIGVTFVHTASPAVAAALIGTYPAQLRNSIAALGADDATITEQRAGRTDGAPAVSFRLTFTPPTIPQIPPVWLVTAVAAGADIVLAQTSVFPAVTAYDYLPTARAVQQHLVGSLRVSG